ncbi:hypothetical protein BJX61DRAFT_533360 [Aspergillus egyptiacus]|nr:hypothetical protein BJX61DRAFT_533360 [Aspergillus egyptiacus]
MDSGRDFRSIINSEPFTFLVGPNHTKLTIQTGLTRHVSGPLDHLMNSGQTRESKHQIAVLEDEDVETFVAFCEYAYTGDYSVPPPGQREDEKEQDFHNNPFKGMFSGNDGGAPPTVGSVSSSCKSMEGLNRTHEDSFWEDENGEADGGTGDELAGDLSQKTPQEDEFEWYPLSTSHQSMGPATPPRVWDQSPTPPADVSVSSRRGRRRYRDTADEQGAIQDHAPTLTPPCTPPGAARLGSVKHSVPNSTGSLHNLDRNSRSDHSITQFDDWGHMKMDEHRSEPDNHQQVKDTSPERPVIDTSFANRRFSPGHGNGTSLWDKFASIDKADSRSSFSQDRKTNPLPGFGLPYLIFHAKLYVFATRFLIPDLAHLCLRKLHRDLLDMEFPDSDHESQYGEQFVLTTTKARMVVDLLSYTYTRTTRLEPITSTSATQLRDNELRRLVVHYAACKVRDLAEYCPPTEPIGGFPLCLEKPSARGFRALLDTLPELASDLIYRMI